MSTHTDQDDPPGNPRGRDAESPSRIPRLGWKDVLLRMAARFTEDRVMLIAAGATFYLLLAIFPALAAFVSLYGLFADPVSIADHLALLGGLLPPDTIEILETQLLEFATEDRDSLSLSFLIAFLVAFWSANNGIKTLFEALNIAYREREKRSFIRLNLIAFVFTGGLMVASVVLIVFLGVLPVIVELLPLDEATDFLLRHARWPIMFVLAVAGISILYRFGPSRVSARWRWISWGGLLACLAWLAASAGFSFYMQGFADYNATYGSLGAGIGFMMWTWISVIVLMVGAQLNAELEHQTARDTTVGEPRPMGERGAVVADTLGEASAESEASEGDRDR